MKITRQQSAYISIFLGMCGLIIWIVSILPHDAHSIEEKYGWLGVSVIVLSLSLTAFQSDAPNKNRLNFFLGTAFGASITLIDKERLLLGMVGLLLLFIAYKIGKDETSSRS